MAGLMPVDVSRALVTATSSSRFVVPNYWLIPKQVLPIRYKWKYREQLYVHRTY